MLLCLIFLSPWYHYGEESPSQNKRHKLVFSANCRYGNIIKQRIRRKLAEVLAAKCSFPLEKEHFCTLLADETPGHVYITKR